MSYGRRLQQIFVLALVVSLLAGCAGAQAVPTATPVQPTSVPTPTLVPPTATPLPPTTTPVPPTHTPVPPSATPPPTHTRVPASPTPQLPSRILFIGDSDSFWLDQHLKNLAASADPPLVIETSGVTSGGMSLEQHWQLLLGLKAVREGNWDVVVLQEDIALHWSELDKFYEYAGKFDQEIEKIGAQTVLYMPHEYKKKIDPPLTTEDYAAVYGKLGAELGDKVAPAGLAWQRSMRERPDLELYARDGHGNLHGMYLTLCVLYATIFERSPVGLAYHYDVPFGSVEFNMRRAMEGMKDWKTISDDEAAFLQRIAWETVQEYETPH
jgi:hypothetical protein